MDDGFVKYNLLYRASDYNFSLSEFHRKCDGKGKTLVLLRTDADKIIGGYTPVEWGSEFGYKCDFTKKTFIFSVTEN